MKMKMASSALPFIQNEVGKSESIPTTLTRQEVIDFFADYGHTRYNFDRERKRIILKKNFYVKLNTEKIDSEKLINLKFVKDNKFRSLWLYPIMLIVFFLSRANAFGSIIVLFLSVLILIKIHAKISQTRGKFIDYSEEADKIVLEISNAIKEKELNQK